jgi:ATP-dependent DNA helicase RecG
LNQLELSEGENLINAGKALFADDLIQDIQMAIFATEDRLTFNDIQRHHGSVLKLVEIAENYIKSNIHWRVEFTGALQRTEIPEVPMDAIREALLNSFCHKDYSTGQSNEVAIYKDRIEIYNPGAFPEGFEPQDFIERPERPIRRNPKIARILYYSKDIESFGTGLKRIADACENAGVRYEFKKLKSGFVVCFYRSEKSTDKVRKSDGKATGKRRKSSDKNQAIKASDKKQATKTSDNIQKIRSFLEKNGAAKSREIADYINLSPARTRVILRAMDDVETVGENKNRRYRLKS